MESTTKNNAQPTNNYDQNVNKPHVWLSRRAGDNLWCDIQSWKYENGSCKEPFMRMNRKITLKNDEVRYDTINIGINDLAELKNMITEFEKIHKNYFEKKEQKSEITINVPLEFKI